MDTAEPTLLHLPFFEALAATDEESPQWRLTSAGLVTLRLFDAWVVEGPSVVAADAWGLRAIRDAIERLQSSSNIKAILGSVVDAMEASDTVRVAVVAPRLLAYARALQFDGAFRLAADVHSTVLAHAHPIDESDLVIAASLQLGVCLRAVSEWEEAAAAFSRASVVASMSGDIVSVLRARIHEANMAMERGNIPRAQGILDETIQNATANGLVDVRARAVHARAVVAMKRGEFEHGIRLAYEAFRDQAQSSERDRILSDIALSFFDLGMRSAARDAYLILAATAQEQYQRWIATINLMECAAADGREPVFEQYRRELADAALPSTLACHYHFYVGEGYRLFGRLDESRAALERSLTLASQHGINEMIIRAEQSLKKIGDGGVVIIAETPAPSREVAEVASAIRGMRELAGVAG